MKITIQVHRTIGTRNTAKAGETSLPVSFFSAFPTGAALAAVMAMVMAMAMTACAVVPPSEFENFVAQAPNKRIMNKVHITWEARPDAAQYCRRVL